MEPVGRTREIAVRTNVVARMRGLGARRPLASSVASFTVAQIGATGAYVFANLLLARSMSPGDYGRVAFGFNIQLLLLLAAGLGLTAAVISEVSRARANGSFPWPGIITLAYVRFSSALLVVAACALWSFATHDALPALAGAAAAAFIVQDFLVGILKGDLRTTPAAVITVAQPLAFVFLVIILSPRGAEATMLAFVVAFACSLLPTFALTVAYRRRGTSNPAAAVSKLKGAWQIAGYGYVMTFLQAGFYVVPTVLLGLAGRYPEAAAFSILISMVRLVPEIVAAVLQAAYFPRVRAATSAAEADRLFRPFLGSLVGSLVIPAVGLGLFAQPVLRIAFAGRYDHVAEFVPLATPLLVALPVESLLVWTLLALGRGGAAILAQTVRLGIVTCATFAFLLGGSSGSLMFVVSAVVTGVAVSLTAQLVTYIRIQRRAIEAAEVSAS